MMIKRYGRSWAVYDTAGVLSCICLYKREYARGGQASDQPGASTRRRTRPQGEESPTSPVAFQHRL
jgi:hypothetical protein